MVAIASLFVRMRCDCFKSRRRREARDATAVCALALLAAFLLAQNVDASDRNSAKFLVPACQRFVALSDGDTLVSALHQGVCVGIIEGIGYVSGSLPPGLRSCLPEGVTQEQMVGAIVSYIKRRPERMHEDFRELAIEAMREAWPCD